jgi:hypothetical protein
MEKDKQLKELADSIDKQIKLILSLRDKLSHDEKTVNPTNALNPDELAKIAISAKLQKILDYLSAEGCDGITIDVEDPWPLWRLDNQDSAIVTANISISARICVRSI